jgi:hypothetical protein
MEGDNMLTRENVWEVDGDWAAPILWYARFHADRETRTAVPDPADGVQ